MTERALPQVGARRSPHLDAPTRPAERVGPGAIAHPGVARAAGARRDAILTTPARAGMLLGASAALYAVTLAGVSALQADTDATAIAARAPYLDVVAQTRAANDDLEARLLKADAEVRALVATYAAVGDDIAAYQARLDSLAALVAEVEGSAAALPARIKLPSVSMRGAVAGTSRSGGGSSGSTSARTGASGG
jgi:hypothetical protein